MGLKDKFIPSKRKCGTPHACLKGTDEDKTRLKNIVGCLQKIAHDNDISFLDSLENSGVKVSFDPGLWKVGYAAVDAQFAFQEGKYAAIPGTLEILLNPTIWRKKRLALSALHEARHLSQYMSGFFMPGKVVSRADVTWFLYVMEADAESFAALQAFKLKRVGDDSLFRVGKSRFYGRRRIYQAVENAYRQDPSSLENGRARRAAFDAFFTYAGLKEAYAERAVHKHRHLTSIFSSSANARVEALSAAEVEGIGVVGGEKINYLTLPGFRPLNDLYYQP